MCSISCLPFQQLEVAPLSTTIVSTEFLSFSELNKYWKLYLGLSWFQTVAFCCLLLCKYKYKYYNLIFFGVISNSKIKTLGIPLLLHHSISIMLNVNVKGNIVKCLALKIDVFLTVQIVPLFLLHSLLHVLLLLQPILVLWTIKDERLLLWTLDWLLNWLLYLLSLNQGEDIEHIRLDYLNCHLFVCILIKPVLIAPTPTTATSKTVATSISCKYL